MSLIKKNCILFLDPFEMDEAATNFIEDTNLTSGQENNK